MWYYSFIEQKLIVNLYSYMFSSVHVDTDPTTYVSPSSVRWYQFPGDRNSIEKDWDKRTQLDLTSVPWAEELAVCQQIIKGIYLRLPFINVSIIQGVSQNTIVLMSLKISTNPGDQWLILQLIGDKIDLKVWPMWVNCPTF